MTVSVVTATVVHGEDRHDVAVPMGTTVSGLLAMLKIDTSDPDTTITLADGRSASSNSAIGRDLPAGVLITITEAKASKQAQIAADQAQDDQWVESWTTILNTLVFVVGLEVAALWIPVVTGFSAGPWWLRIVIGVICLSGAGLLARRPGLLRSNAGAALLPAVVGNAFVAVISPSDPFAVPLAATVAVWATMLASFAIWLNHREGPQSSSAVMWTLVALLVTAGVLTGDGMSFIAPLAMTLGVMAIQIVPDFSMRVPDTQLVDMPLLLTSAPSVRGQSDVASPSRITNRRVRRTLTEATAMSETTTVFGSCVVVAVAPWVAAGMNTSTWSGWGAIVTLVCAVIALLTVPRTYRSRLARIAPRVAAGLIIVAVAALLASRGSTDALYIGGLLFLLASLGIGGVLLTTQEPGYPLLGRIADISQSLALAFIGPASILASGLFDAVRQMTL